MIVFSSTLISIILYTVFRSKGVESKPLNSFPTLLDGQNYSHDTFHVTMVISTIKEPMNSTIYLSTNIIASSLADAWPIIIKQINGTIILDLANVSLLTLSLLTTIWSLIKIRKLNYRRTMTRKQ